MIQHIPENQSVLKYVDDVYINWITAGSEFIIGLLCRTKNVFGWTEVGFFLNNLLESS